MNRNRLEAFSDGIFAIAATLLVLSIPIPQDVPTAKALLHALLILWPQYLGYVTSFLLIGIFWMNHHSIFHYVPLVDRSIVWRNLLFLMCIAFLPFPTAVIGRYGMFPPAVMFYGLMLLLTSIVVNFSWQHMVRGGYLDSAMVTPEQLRRASARYAAGGVVCIAAIAVGPFAPHVSLVLYFLLAIYYLFPGGLERNVIRPASSEPQ